MAVSIAPGAATSASPSAVLSAAGGGVRSSESRARWAVPLFGLAIFALALGPRWVARDTYVTADEDNWMRRAGGFAWGMANGRPGRTYQNGHPGVLTMELAILGQGPGGAERFADPITGNPRVVTAVPGFFDGLVEARRAFALATALLVAGLAAVAWRLFGPGPAVLGGVLLALDPFYLAHSQLVHLDAVLSGCMVLAVLCGLVRWSGNGGRGWLVAGGATSGLALLAKVPAVYLGLFIPLLALALGRRRGARVLLVDLATWGATALVVCALLWPSLWVNPLGTLERMIDFARETGGQPHEQGSYFLGRAVVDPGPLFYPIAVLLRLSPLTSFGLVVLALIGLRAPTRLGSGPARLALALVAYVAGFALLMTLGAKKFDRYLLPAFPALDLLAGLGLWVGWRVVGARSGDGAIGGSGGISTAPSPHRPIPRSPRVIAAWALFLVLAAWSLASVSPHYLAYYNPLLGGGATALRAIPVGEGEGLKEVATWLNAQPEAERLHVVSDSFDALKANFVGGGEPLRERVPASADFVVLYAYQMQLEHSPQVVADYARQEAEYVVRLNGIEYARIYRGPRQRAGALTAPSRAEGAS